MNDPTYTNLFGVNFQTNVMQQNYGGPLNEEMLPYSSESTDTYLHGLAPKKATVAST
jgi:hypothetical protein